MLWRWKLRNKEVCNTCRHGNAGDGPCGLKDCPFGPYAYNPERG